MPHGLTLASFDAVLFDVDGTLVDSLDMIVLGIGDTYERFSGMRPHAADLLRTIGKPLPAQFGLFGHAWSEAELAEMTAFAIQRFRVHEERERMFAPAIQTLRMASDRGLRTALVTSKTTPELDDFMTRFPGAPWVDVTVCASDVERPKPDPQSAARACERLGVQPHRAVMIGDSVYDLRCARGAGVACVAVAYGAGQREALAAEAPDLLLDTPEALLAWAESAFLQPSCRERSLP
ncbi:MAG: HAD family hydrolase [Fimbriimonas sp.]